MLQQGLAQRKEHPRGAARSPRNCGTMQIQQHKREQFDRSYLSMTTLVTVGSERIALVSS